MDIFCSAHALPTNSNNNNDGKLANGDDDDDDDDGRFQRNQLRLTVPIARGTSYLLARVVALVLFFPSHHNKH